MASIIVLFHKKSDRQNFYFQKKKVSKVHVKWVAMEQDNACEIVNGEPEKQDRELKRNDIYIKVKQWKVKSELSNMKKVIIL